jgi:hypothetical protein
MLTDDYVQAVQEDRWARARAARRIRVRGGRPRRRTLRALAGDLLARTRPVPRSAGDGHGATVDLTAPAPAVGGVARTGDGAMVHCSSKEP